MADDNFSSFIPTAKKPAPVRWQRPDGSPGELTVEELEQLKRFLKGANPVGSDASEPKLLEKAP